MLKPLSELWDDSDVWSIPTISSIYNSIEDAASYELTLVNFSIDFNVGIVNEKVAPLAPSLIELFSAHILPP
jgi:hypothetical protein